MKASKCLKNGNSWLWSYWCRICIFLQRYGIDVTIVEYLPNIVPVEDIDVSKQLEKLLRKKVLVL